MGSTRHVALLRGINVGGKNIVAMSELRAAFDDAGFDRVSTYIQSGNVLFGADTPRDSLEVQLEAMLAERFATPLMVMLRTHRQLRNVVTNAPEGFGAEPDTYHSDVIFLKSKLRSQEAMRVVKLRDGVDQAWPGAGVLYFARRSDQLGKSRMSRIIGTPEYQQMTIRSWKTTTKLLALLDETA